MKKTLLVLLLVILSVGCAAKKDNMYDWGDYPHSLYKIKKEPSDENLQNHKLVLVRIMEDSKKDGLRVPPGVYCEYGYILSKEGKTDDALKYYNLEMYTYPESAVFVKRLESKMTNSQGVKP
jgi:hypothetical protein